MPGDIFQARKIPFSSHTLSLAQDILLGCSGLAREIARMPDINFFIKACRYKEAVMTSRITGTTASLEDFYSSFIANVSPEKRDDIAEINAYNQALEIAMELRKRGPLDSELIRQTHAVLLRDTRGKDRCPGEFRDGLVCLRDGVSHAPVFVPPPAAYVPSAMDNLIQFMQDKETFILVPIKAALIHYQFETIHPFRDGNGRIGRMVLALYLHAVKAIPHPAVLYMSSYFNRHRKLYDSHLALAHESIEGLINWTDFCLGAIMDTVINSTATAKKISGAYSTLEAFIQSQRVQHKDKHLALLRHFFLQPVASIASVQEALGISRYAASRYIKRFVAWGILEDKRESKKTGRYVFPHFLDLFEGDNPTTDQLQSTA